MSKSFKQMSEEQPKHFRVLEKDGKLIKRTYRSDNSYKDVDLEEDLQLYEFCMGFTDMPH